MKHFRLRLLVAAIVSLPVTQFAYAAAFQFYELGTPINGSAAVGQAVITSDASTSYFNPAGMTQFSSNQFLLGTQMALAYTNFSPNASNTIPGSNGSNAGGIAPGAAGYFIYNYSPKLKLGASFNMPYAGALDYDPHWVGRYK